MNELRTIEFRGKFCKSESEKDFLYSFPFQILLARARIGDFYREYRIQ